MILIFDLGATHIRYSLVHDGKMGEVVRLDTDSTARGFETWLAAMQKHVGAQRIEAVVGGMAGELVGAQGRLTVSPNLPAWIGQPVRQRLEEVFGCPVHVLNDVEMGGLGEAHDGAGTTHGVMAYFTVSTGVNAVRLVDGKIDSTIAQFELGQELVDIGQPGSKRTLESLVGGAATRARFGIAPAEIADKRLWQNDAKVLARVIYDTSLYWVPGVVVFGGSMMRDIGVPAVERALHELPLVLTEWPKLKTASLGDLAGLHGSMRWWEQQKSA